MAVLTNTMMQGASADTGGEDYQIENSLRFNSADSAYLSRTFGLGNRRTFTWASWVKRSKLGATQSLFNCHPSSNDKAYLELHSEDKLGHNSYHSSTWWNGGTDKSPEVFRDPSAWYHIVFTLDTTNEDPDDRYRFYVNGKRLTHPGGDYGLNILNSLNNAFQHNIGGNYNDSNYGDFSLADVHFIDGLALSPAAFGQFNSLGIWDPKAFVLPAPNKGTTLSGGWAGTFTSGLEATKSFDGLLSTGSKPSNTNTITWTGDIEVKQGVRIYFECDDHSSAKYADIFVNGLAITPTAYNAHWDSADVVNWGDNNLTEIKTTQDNNKATTIKAIEVDGVRLVDGKTDTTIRKNANNRTTWSDAFAGGNFNSGNGATLAFDGSTATMARPDTSQTITWTAPTSIAFNTLEFCGWNDSISDGVVINGVNISSTIAGVAGDQWTDITSLITSPLSTIVIKADSGTSKASFRGVKINGNVLIDSTVDNSCHLKFNDTSRNSALGRDSFTKGKLTDATGALPFYNTTDAYGEVIGSGNRTDSNSGDLVFAMPGTTLTDVSTSPHTMTNSGVAVATDEYKFYGSSLYFSGDSLSAPYHADFLNGYSGNFTIEAWVKTTASGRSIMGVWNWSASKKSWNMYIGGSGPVLITSVDGTNQVDIAQSSKTCHTGDWCHVAFVRNSNTVKCYVDGVETGSSSFSGTLYDTTDSAFYIGGTHGAGEFVAGNIQDARIYKAAKYTAAFKPPIRNDWRVNNIRASDAVGSVITKTTGDQSLGHWHGRTYPSTPPADGTGDRLMYMGRGDAVFTFTPAIASSGNITCRCYTDGGSSGDNKLRFYDGSAWSSWIDFPAGSGYDWSDISTTVSNLEKVELDYAGGDPNIAGFFINGGTANSDWWQFNKLEADDSKDSPTNYTDDSDVARGNYCTLNPHEKASNSTGGLTFKDGNLYAETTSSSGQWSKFRGTLGVPKGSTDKFYYEVEWLQDTGNTDLQVGWTEPDRTITAVGFGDFVNEYCFRGDNGKFFHAGTQHAYGSAPSQGDVIGVGYDNGAIRFFINGTEQNSGTAATTGVSKLLVPGFGLYCQSSDTIKVRFNFGQRAFKYPQSGYKTLCSQNLDDLFSGDELNNPSKYFDVKLFTGTAAAHTVSFEFQPDLIWHKERNSAQWHMLMDSARGEGSEGLKKLYSNEVDAEDSSFGDSSNKVTLDGNGVKFWSNGHVNTSGDKFVLWAWDAGTAAATASTDGSITPTAQWKNATAGFSITKYTGTGANATIGHALGAKPDFFLIKDTASYDWFVWHSGMGVSKAMKLHNTDAAYTDDSQQDTLPTNTVIYLSNAGTVNHSGNTKILYSWTAIPGYSAFGSYTGTGGNGSTVDQFVYTGFTPRFLIIKSSTAGTTQWMLVDNERDKTNPNKIMSWADSNGAEENHENNELCMHSNGFELTSNTYQNYCNISGETYVYAAFADHPFKLSRAK